MRAGLSASSLRSVATPKLAVISSEIPLTVTGVVGNASRRRSASLAASVGLVFGRQNRKLLATDAGQHVRRAQQLTQPLGKLAQHLIACGMARLIVHALKRSDRR